jgi:hypothetical protein
MIEIGPNLTTVLLALTAVLSLLAQSTLANRHAEAIQRNGSTGKQIPTPGPKTPTEG